MGRKWNDTAALRPGLHPGRPLRLYPKDLRDTFASQLFSAGIELHYIQEMLGHADASTTVPNYVKAIEEARQRPRIDVDHTSGELPMDLLERLCRQWRRAERRKRESGRTEPLFWQSES